MEPPRWEDDEDGQPRKPVRRFVTRAVAVTLIIALIVAFPLGYVIETMLRRQRPDVVLALVEVVAVVVIWIVIRVSRRR